MTGNRVSFLFSLGNTNLTFFGRISTRCWSKLILGINTDIFRGPLMPHMLTSYCLYDHYINHDCSNKKAFVCIESSRRNFQPFRESQSLRSHWHTDDHQFYWLFLSTKQPIRVDSSRLSLRLHSQSIKDSIRVSK